jgi:hypothetical protein
MDTDTPFDKIVVREAKGKASPREVAMLREQPRQWLASLTKQRKAAEAHVASRRVRLRRLAHDMGVGTPGRRVPDEYLREKYEVDRANAATVRFINGLNSRMAEVKAAVDATGTQVEFSDALEALAVARSILKHPHDDRGAEQCRQFLDRTMKRFRMV